MPELAHLRVRYGADGAGGTMLVLRRLGDGLRRWHAYRGMESKAGRLVSAKWGSVTIRRIGKQ